MKIKEIIGIDVSKLSLDVHLHLSAESSKFNNDPDGIFQMIQWCEKRSGLKREALFFIFEHTGLYSYPLAKQFTALGIAYRIEPGLAVKRSLGITRGKNDNIDAKKLALYGYRLRDELTPCQLADKEIQQLKSLLKLRDRMVKQRAGYKASLKEQKRVLDQNEYQLLLDTQQALIIEFSLHIKKLDDRIKAIVTDHSRLKALYKLITSIKGVGRQTAIHIIVVTHGFTRFKAWRAFAAYCGTAPFPYQSGSSIIGKNKVSHLANKNIKKLVNMCAISAIQHDTQLKTYYQRKVKQGKAKMSVINAVRNKILARIFAVVNRETPYVDTFKFAT